MPPPAPTKPQIKPTITPRPQTGKPLPGTDRIHRLLGGHHRPDEELDAQEEGHKYREAAHGRVGEKAGDPASHQGEQENYSHHHKAVFNVQVFVFVIDISADRAGEHVAGQGDPHRLIGRQIQERDEHGGNDGRSAHTRKAGPQAGADPGHEADEKGVEHCLGISFERKAQIFADAGEGGFQGRPAPLWSSPGKLYAQRA